MPKRSLFCVLLRAPEGKTVAEIEEAIIEGARGQGYEVEVLEVSEADESCLM